MSIMKDAFYFPHFCNARHDRKIKRLRKELGIEGYGIYFMLLELLREQLNFNYPLADVDLLTEEFGTSEQKIRVTITNYQLFELDEEDNFFSPKLIEYLQPYMNMKKQRRQAGLKSGEIRREKSVEKLNNRSTDAQTNVQTTVELMVNENEQRKVKESKGKESKINESKENKEQPENNLLTLSFLKFTCKDKEIELSKNDVAELEEKYQNIDVKKKLQYYANYLERDDSKKPLCRNFMPKLHAKLEEWNTQDNYDEAPEMTAEDAEESKRLNAAHEKLKAEVEANKNKVLELLKPQGEK